MEETIKKLSNLQPFIDYLKSTKDDQWLVDKVRTKDGKKNCVMGHLIDWFYGKDYEGSISAAWDIFESMWATIYMIYPVNDGNSPSWMNFKYDQPTPKERVIAYLQNLQDGKEDTTDKLGEKEFCKKCITKYVTGKVLEYSMKVFGEPICFTCQKKVRTQKEQK